MPKRSTLFQRAIYYFKEHLADGRYEVVESMMLRENVTGRKREVDVVLTTVVSGHVVNVCLECIEHKRPADITWIEQMHSKHAKLPTSRLVLVSRSGFTKPARQAASNYGIEILTPEQVTESEIGEIVRVSRSIVVAEIDTDIQHAEFFLAASPVSDADWVVVDGDWQIYNANGNCKYLARELMDTVRQKTELHFRTELPLPEWANFELELCYDPDSATGPQPEIFVQVDHPRVQLIQIQKIAVRGRMRGSIDRIRMTAGVLQGVSHSYGEGRIGRDHAAAFMTQLSEDTATLTISVSKSPASNSQRHMKK